MSCSSAARRKRLTSSVSSPRTVAVASTSCATPSACASRSGWRSARAWSRTFLDCDSTGARRECFCAYIRWSAASSASADSAASRGSVTAPYEQPMWKPSPCSVNAAAAPRMIGSATWGPRAEEHAELVPAHAVRVAAAVDVPRQRAAQALEQGIAGRMPEAVVVVLEAVEVEEHQDQRVGVIGRRDPARKGVGERAAVPEPGERVRQRLAAGLPDHRDVGLEREQQAGHDGDERERGQRDGERVERRDRGVDQQPEPDQPEAERHEDEADRLAVRRGVTLVRLPGGDADREQPAPPPDVEPAAGVVRACHGGDRIQRVGEPEGDDPAREQTPPASRRQPIPASEPAMAASMTMSVTRIRECDAHADRIAGHVRVERLEHQRRAHRADRERRR